jgi:hypothetical protein
MASDMKSMDMPMKQNTFTESAFKETIASKNAVKESDRRCLLASKASLPTISS